jgi:hypothetical protein
MVDPRASIGAERGRWRRQDGLWVLPTYHPAYLLRAPERKKEVWEDFQMIRELHRRLFGWPSEEAAAAREAPAGPAGAPDEGG